MAKGTKMKCAECGKNFVRKAGTNRIYCSRSCLDASRAKKTQEQNERRKQLTAARPAPICRVCGQPIIRASTGRTPFYHKGECAAKGIELAVERQRKKRELKKAGVELNSVKDRQKLDELVDEEREVA